MLSAYSSDGGVSVPLRPLVAAPLVSVPHTLLAEKIARLLELCLGIRPTRNELSCHVETAVTLDFAFIL